MRPVGEQQGPSVGGDDLSEEQAIDRVVSADRAALVARLRALAAELATVDLLTPALVERMVREALRVSFAGVVDESLIEDAADRIADACWQDPASRERLWTIWSQIRAEKPR